MPIFQVPSRIVKNKKIAKGIFQIRISAPKVVSSAYAGQFVMLRVRNELNPLLRRPFSFHRLSPDKEEGTFEILFKVVGEGTYIMSQLQPWSVIDILGPLGKGFRFPPEKSRKIWLIAGGIGIAPLFALVEMLNRGDIHSSIELYYGASTAHELLNLQFFRNHGASVNTCTDDGTRGDLGLVTDIVEKVSQSGDLPDYFYSCGPVEMQRSVIKWARSYNITGQVSMETVMACGMGVCMGCSIPKTLFAEKPKDKQGGYYRVCLDGPVFDIGDGSWT